MKEGKPEIVQYRINRAKETLDEVEFLIENELLTTAVNRLYYACFYAVLALLTKHDIQTKTHQGMRQMFGLHFIRPGIVSQASGSFYKDIFDLRQEGDYEDYIVFEKEKVLSLLQPAQNLIAEITQILSKQ
jgi:uncharacterized protein (UPF0332 family)